MRSSAVVLSQAACALVLQYDPVSAQEPACKLICAPAFTLSSGVGVPRVLGGDRVRLLPANTETSIDPQADLFLFLTVDMPTAIPRFNLVAQVGWSPTADRSSNPLTGYTAAQLAADNIAANELEIELGGTVALIRPQDTKGLFGLKVGAFDQIGDARQRPDDERTYTHKLDLGDQHQLRHLQSPGDATRVRAPGNPPMSARNRTLKGWSHPAKLGRASSTPSSCTVQLHRPAAPSSCTVQLHRPAAPSSCTDRPPPRRRLRRHERRARK